jgi:hypothetical protein
MSCDDSIHWRARAEEMRVLAEEVSGGISKHVMQKIAEDYERFARMIEERPNRFLAIPPVPPVLPADVRRFAPCKSSVGAPRRVIDLEIPGFLKRGPATPVELEAST